MSIELDPDAIRSLLDSWRVASDFAQAQDDRTKVLLLARRGEVLANLAITAGAWLALLRQCGVRSPELEQLEAQLREFRSWARDQLRAWRALCEEEPVDQ